MYLSRFRAGQGPSWAGAFASLERLELQLRSDLDGACALLNLRKGLLAAPCTRTLRSLTVRQGSMPASSGRPTGSFPKSLGEAIADGLLPALVELNLYDNLLTEDGVRELLAPFTAAKPWAVQELLLHRTGVGDEGVAAVAAALEEGWLGSELRVLKFAGRTDRGEITEEGMVRLREALLRGARHVQRLEVLDVIVPGMTTDAITAFLPVVPCLPALCELRLAIATDKVTPIEAQMLMEVAQVVTRGKKGVVNVDRGYQMFDPFMSLREEFAEFGPTD